MSTEHTHTSAQVERALQSVDDFAVQEIEGFPSAGFILAAEVRRLREEREYWRTTALEISAAHDKVEAENDELKAKIAALVSAGDAMQDDFQRYIATRGGFSTGAPRPSVNAWDAAKSSELPTP